jgi:hypothetical protein
MDEQHEAVRAEAAAIFAEVDTYPGELPQDLMDRAVNCARRAKQMALTDVSDQFRARDLPA